jgi:hypothetical protein
MSCTARWHFFTSLRPISTRSYHVSSEIVVTRPPTSSSQLSPTHFRESTQHLLLTVHTRFSIHQNTKLLRLRAKPEKQQNRQGPCLYLKHYAFTTCSISTNKPLGLDLRLHGSSKHKRLHHQVDGRTRSPLATLPSRARKSAEALVSKPGLVDRRSTNFHLPSPLWLGTC